MQGTQQVEKFLKKKRLLVDGHNEEAKITTGKKLNKTKRGGGHKYAFLNSHENLFKRDSSEGY